MRGSATQPHVGTDTVRARTPPKRSAARGPTWGMNPLRVPSIGHRTDGLSDLGRQSQDGLSVVRWITATDNDTAQRVYDKVAEKTEWVTYDLVP